MAELLWTIGHSTHTQLQLVQLLKQNNINLLIDVRTIPRSGKNPQFNKDTLSEDLPQQHGIKYIWLGKELGGLRRRNKELHVNDGWENLSFRGYADYMQTPAFKDGIQQLKQLALEEGPAAVMCAEAMYFSCHRRLISDALTVSGWQVWHIMPQDNTPPAKHTLTPWAHVEGNSINYPATAAAAAAASKRKPKGKKQSAAADVASKPQAAAVKTTSTPLLTEAAEDAASGGQRMTTRSMTTRSNLAAKPDHTNTTADHSAESLSVKPSTAVVVDGGELSKGSRGNSRSRGQKQQKIDQIMHRQQPAKPGGTNSA